MQQEQFKIALFGNIYQEKKTVAVQEFFSIVSQLNAEILIPAKFLDFIRDRLKINVPECTVIKDNINENNSEFECYGSQPNEFDADVVVCMGGDGTFLDVAGRVGDKQIPIVGINTGRLGFLANFSPKEMEQILHNISEGNYEVEEHSLIELSCDELDLQNYPCALNEIAILKHDISAMISIHTSINGEYLTTYQADGLIVGTPTGSTAYSLSVGGPIIVPHLDTISLTPVAPHSLNMRPIVVMDDSVIDLQVESRSGNFLISLDGRSCSYRDNIHLHIRKASYKIKVVVNPEHSFFSTLRQKMMWGADLRH